MPSLGSNGTDIEVPIQTKSSSYLYGYAGESCFENDFPHSKLSQFEYSTQCISQSVNFFSTSPWRNFQFDIGGVELHRELRRRRCPALFPVKDGQEGEGDEIQREEEEKESVPEDDPVRLMEITGFRLVTMSLLGWMHSVVKMGVADSSTCSQGSSSARASGPPISGYGASAPRIGECGPRQASSYPVSMSPICTRQPSGQFRSRTVEEVQPNCIHGSFHRVHTKRYPPGKFQTGAGEGLQPKCSHERFHLRQANVTVGERMAS